MPPTATPVPGQPYIDFGNQLLSAEPVQLMLFIGVLIFLALLILMVSLVIWLWKRPREKETTNNLLSKLLDVTQDLLTAQKETLEIQKQTRATYALLLTVDGKVDQVVANIPQARSEYQEALKEARVARLQMVADMNAHTDAALVKTDQAITDARTANQAQHSEQAEKIEQQMNNLQQAIEQNGKTRKEQYDDIQEQLRTMTETLTALHADMQALNAQVQDSQAQKDAITAIGKKVDTLSTAFDQLKKELTPPAPPPTTPPSVDSLANVPPKAVEKEDNHA